jgi:phosphoadenosine phosphosulfate reductase
MRLPQAAEALESAAALAEWNAYLDPLSAPERVAFALEHLPGPQVLASSFGAQSAVSLHMVARQQRVPVILIDTGYLFPETYQFVDQLQQRLDLDLRIYRAATSPAWQEARYGRLWEQGLSGIDRYNEINKVEPMRRALNELGIRVWHSGVRRDQSSTRAVLPVLAVANGRFKLHPIIDWTDRIIGRYLSQHGLPYHPLWDLGYVSIGDTHTTSPLSADIGVDQTRFFGLKRECGLHTAA